MVRIELAQQIGRPPAEVFDFLTDLERLPEWQASAVEARADGALAEGTRIVEKRRLMGREHETELEVTVYEPPSRLTLKALNGPVRFTVEHELSGDGDGTSLHVVAQAEPATFMKLAGPLLARKAEEELRNDFDRLKELLEGQGGDDYH
jgi:uncharacterized protein YndB with AHSA1/START domain